MVTCTASAVSTCSKIIARNQLTCILCWFARAHSNWQKTVVVSLPFSRLLFILSRCSGYTKLWKSDTYAVVGKSLYNIICMAIIVNLKPVISFITGWVFNVSPGIFNGNSWLYSCFLCDIREKVMLLPLYCCHALLFI